MTWLALCIVFTSFLILGFKYFQQYNVATMPGIAINYLTCSSCAFLWHFYHSGEAVTTLDTWVYLSVALGMLFIVVFYLIGKTAMTNGVTITAIANKLSVVIPISLALFLYGEKVTGLKIAGIMLALVSVVLANIKVSGEKQPGTFMLPALLFVGSGMVDSTINYIQRFHVPEHFTMIFVSIAFGTACVLGNIWAIFNKDSFGKKEIIAGILLGLPNFGSIFCILKALQNPFIEDSIVWTINNVGVIIFSTVYAVIVFKERLNFYNILGILVAVAAILMVTLSQ
jgi:drug/metabolite transporter (DMT)-like permease